MKLGFIGCGNMGGALACAAAKSEYSIALSDMNEALLNSMAEKTGGSVSSNDAIAEAADYIVLGVKPQVLPKVIAGIAPTLKNRSSHFCIVSMAAGVAIDSVREMLGVDCPIIRIMPNTPVEVGKGLVLYTKNALVTEEDISGFLTAFRAAGELSPIAENLIDAASAVSGCGPAFVYMFVSAMADGGVRAGLPRSTAIEYAARTILGSAAMVLETGRHPEALKDAVCSPAGSTIEGVTALEEAGFRAAVIDAVTAAYDRTRELGQK